MSTPAIDTSSGHGAGRPVRRLKITATVRRGTYRRDRHGIWFMRTALGERRIGRRVAILLDAGAGTILDHGASAEVERTRRRLAATRDLNPDRAGALVLIDNARWTPALLERLVGDAVALSQWWRRQVARGALDPGNAARC